MYCTRWPLLPTRKLLDELRRPQGWLFSGTRCCEDHVVVVPLFSFLPWTVQFSDSVLRPLGGSRTASSPVVQRRNGRGSSSLSSRHSHTYLPAYVTPSRNGPPIHLQLGGDDESTHFSRLNSMWQRSMHRSVSSPLHSPLTVLPIIQRSGIGCKHAAPSYTSAYIPGSPQFAR